MNSLASSNDTITIIKAIAILSMVLGHSCVGSPVETIVSQFHMPIFFFVSGFCFKESYYSRPFLFVYRRFLGLWWPYVKWSIVFILLHNCFYHFHIYDSIYGSSYSFGTVEYSNSMLISRIKDVLFWGRTESLLGGYWFLRTLFWGSLISFGILSIFRHFKYGIVLGIFVVLLSLLVDNYFRKTFTIAFIASQEFAASFLFLVGFFFSKYQIPQIRN